MFAITSIPNFSIPNACIVAKIVSPIPFSVDIRILYDYIILFSKRNCALGEKCDNTCMKIVFFETPIHEQELVEKLLPDYEKVFVEEKLSTENVAVAKNADAISVFINSEIQKDILDALPDLKYICTRSTGYDHIDVIEANKRGILVANVPAYGSDTVAEYTFALLLSLSRKIFDGVHQIKEGGDFSIRELRGFDLAHKTIGIIGTGRIGKNVARIARGFNMHVIAYDLQPDTLFAKENGITYKTLEDLAKESDIITLHAPYNKTTHHILNKTIISHMKRGVYIVNTARGELIDTDALIWGLNEKIIAGCGLDVLEGERDIKEEMELLSSFGKTLAIKDYKTLLQDHMLMTMPQVIITPHIAFYSKEAEESILKTTVENITNFFQKNPTNLVK